MTIAQLPEDKLPAVDRQRDDRVGIYVRDESAVDAVDQFHGLLLTTDQALGVAERIMATVGEIVGDAAAVTIWPSEFAAGAAEVGGERHHVLVATDDERRSIRLVFSEEALKQLGQYMDAVARTPDTGIRH